LTRTNTPGWKTTMTKGQDIEGGHMGGRDACAPPQTMTLLGVGHSDRSLRRTKQMRFDAILTCATCGRQFREDLSGFKCPRCIADDECRKMRVVDRKAARGEETRDRIRPLRSL
jgi:hypothetical protein